MTDLKSIEQGRCPVCDSPDFCKTETGAYECFRCGKEFIIKEGNVSEK
jgi:ribosomal protein L37AE/L43A